MPDGLVKRGRSWLQAGTLGKLVAAVLVGFGVGSLLRPGPVALPFVGATPGLVFGAAVVVAGGALYVGVDRKTSGCGCSEPDCDC
jgi:hypothetical protein